VILWVLWRLKLHQPIHHSFSSHGMHQVQFPCYTAPFFPSYYLLLYYYSSVISDLFLNMYVFRQDMKLLFIEACLAIGFKISKSGISHMRVFFYRYSGRGLFLDPPTVFTRNETCTLSLPPWIQHGHLSPGDKCR
jgi:hypothetical protein